MKKGKAKPKASPVRLPSQIKHAHQSHFLLYINTIKVQVAEELKKLTPKCKELFGEFPVPLDADTEVKNFGVWFFEPRDENLRRRWWQIGKIFRECIWKETRDSYGSFHWFPVLKVNDEELNEIINFENNFEKDTFQYVESLPEEKLDKLRELFAPRYTKPKESLSILDLKFSYLSYKKDQAWKNNESYRELMKMKNLKLEPLVEFQKDFDSILEKFYLDKEWLAESVFRAIWNGTGKLLIVGYYSEEIPDDVNIEIEKALKIPNNELPFRETDFPLLPPFIYPEPYLIYDSFENYKEKAINAFSQHLDIYFDAIKKSLTSHGYKKPRGKRYNYKKIQRLIEWNFSNVERLWEVIQHIPEFQAGVTKVDMKDDDEVEKTVDKLRKSFAEFEKYDLPVRPFGDNRK